MMSEDEEPQATTMSKAELRKTHKPIMEKRRRARINHCLNEIKTLILEAMNKDPARHSKLEKADILEMAVKHLQNVQRQQLALAMASDPSVLRKFKNGFNECANEIDTYLGESADTSVKQRVSNHLQKCINGIEQVAQFTFPGLGGLPFLSGVFNGGNTSSSTPQEPIGGDQNNNPRIQIPQGLQLIPSRLPTGELALLVPNSSNLQPYFQNVQRPSAFAAVVPQTNVEESLSPPLSPRSASPHGFRPVQPKRNLTEDHQVPQVSSTQEVKNIRFPIHKHTEKEKRMESSPSRKVSEPLCIITNQNERYRQAQMREDSAGYEENYGVKRKFGETFQPLGLLTVSDAIHRPVKVIKTQLVAPSKEQDDPRNKPSGSRDNNNSDTSDNMWRPW